MKKIGQRDELGSTATKKLARLLYVEDNDDNWRVAELRLGRRYDMIRASGDRDACDILAREGPDLYAVLMDIELSGSRFNGLELTKLIRGTLDTAALPEYARRVPKLDVPVLFLTAYAGIYTREQLNEAGGDDVVTKPVDFTRLNVALANLYIKRVLGRSGR